MYIFNNQSMCYFENRLLSQGYKMIGGIDEAGRGALAGPVVAACVILDPGRIPEGVMDSKKLTPRLREELYKLITLNSVAYGVGVVEPEVIDEINIYSATILAMKKSFLNLKVKPDVLLVDAVKLKDLPVMSISLIKGEEKSVSIAAASIIAKVTRDRILVELSKVYPGYNLQKNKGYPTPEHKRLLMKNGPSKIHRFTYKPVAEAIKKAKYESGKGELGISDRW